MDESWLPVVDAASELGVSVSRVRELLGSGALPGRKLGGVWLVDPLGVQRRGGQSKKSGRPLAAVNAWRLLALLAQPESWRGDPSAAALPFRVSPVERSRLRALLADLPDGAGLARRLSGRAELRRMRAHAGVADRLLADERVSVGAGRAVAARGGGVAAGGADRVYVRARYLAELIGRYRLDDDVEGNVEVAVIPDGVDEELLPAPGDPVPLEVAWADLLDDADSRARGAARSWAESLPRPKIRPEPHHAGRS